MRLIIWSLLTVSLLPLFAYEGIRFFTHIQECHVRQIQNQLLLDNVLCSDPWQTQAHGPKQQAACDKAQKENQVSVVSCAWQEMWLKGELKRVWSSITESQVMLVAFLVPCLMLTIGLLFWSCNERATRKEMFSLHRDIYRQTLGAFQRPSIGGGINNYLEYEDVTPVPRKKRNYVQLIQHE